MSADPQREVQDFLSDPATHGGTPVERIDTHAAMVFLAGERAFKVKRQVRFSFLDFSSLELRRAALESELSLNRRTAPEIYLRVRRITRGVSGGLEWDSAGEIVEWVLEMRRFDQALRLDRLADAGKLTGAMIADLVDALIDLHARAEVLGAPYGGAEDLEGIVRDNTADLGEWPELFPPSEVTSLDEDCWAAWRALAPLLDRRRARGWVRQGHGDLHLANVVLWKGRPTPFDCIEFDLRFAAGDVAYDLAFLLMDLDSRGLRGFANLAMSRFFGRAGGVEILAALPLMLALRAAIRAKVAAPAIGTQSSPEEAEKLRRSALAFFAAARGYLKPVPSRLIAVGGLSGSGKSTLGRALAPGLGRAPGALHLRSDVLRKRLFAVPPETPLPPEAYRADVSARVYALMGEEAETALAAGQAVIVDAVFAREEEREAVAKLAARQGVAFTGFWLDAPAEVLKRRAGERTGDASDATPQVVERQLGYETGNIDWIRLDSSAGAEEVARQAEERL